MDVLNHQFAQGFNYQSSLVPFNNAGLQPITRAAHQALQYWSLRFLHEGFATDQDYKQAVAQTRQRLADLLGCQASELSFYTNVASAVSQVAFTFPLQPGDEVLMSDQDYPSLLYPWQQACQQKGAHLSLVPSGPELQMQAEDWISRLNSKTRVVALSWIQYQTGAIMDLELLITQCKQRDIFIMLDVMQGLGLWPQSFWSLGVDAMVGGSHKWLCSPVGVGYLALRNNWIQRLRPLSIGSQTFGSCDDPADFLCQPKQDAQKFEPGSKQVLEIIALGASLEFLLQQVPHRPWHFAQGLAQLVLDELDRMSLEWVSSNGTQLVNNFLNIRPKKRPLSDLVQHLAVHQIQFAVRAQSVRLSFQAFNNDQHMSTLLKALGSFNYKDSPLKH